MGVGGLGCIAGDCDADCVGDVGRDISGCVGGIRHVGEKYLSAVV